MRRAGASKLDDRRARRQPNKLVKEGEEGEVKLMGFGDRGKVRLSMKAVDPETGKEIKRETAKAEG